MADGSSSIPVSRRLRSASKESVVNSHPVVTSENTPSTILSSKSLSTRLRNGDKQKDAMLAVRAFHSPNTNILFTTKTQAAAAYGVSKQLFHKMESEMLSSGVLESIVDGTIPEPDVPELQQPEEASIEFDASAMGTVKAMLESSCTRLGDNAPYGKHCTVGMYREGLKGAVGHMQERKLPPVRERSSVIKPACISDCAREICFACTMSVTMPQYQVPCMHACMHVYHVHAYA